MISTAVGRAFGSTRKHFVMRILNSGARNISPGSSGGGDGCNDTAITDAADAADAAEAAEGDFASDGRALPITVGNFTTTGKASINES